MAPRPRRPYANDPADSTIVHLVNQRRIVVTAAGLVDVPGHRPHAKAILGESVS